MKKSKPLIHYAITSNGVLSDYCLSHNIIDFESLSQWLRHLPYGRTTCRKDLTQLFRENRGTCSSKHGLFKSVAMENNYPDFKLMIGLYKMNSRNTAGIKGALVNTGLEYIPEAHSYIRWKNVTLDLTNANSSFENIKSDIIEELEIEPSQIGQFKVHYHKQYLKDWISNQEIELDFDTVWNLRERCISNLSN